MELTTKVLSIIRKDTGYGKPVRPEDRIVEDLKIDSLDKLMIINDLEDEFNITVADDELQHVRIVQDIIDAVGKKMSIAQD